ncbi:MAG: HEAT repeat protein [Planctomycetota bacterium]|jgi:HEAT repeat protein
MSRIRRNLSLLVALALAAPAFAGDLQDAFEQGVKLLKEGQREEALVQFQRALAADPSNDEAYQLWKDTDHHHWLSMMVEGGDFELIAHRLMERAKLAHKARSNDSDTIKGLVATLKSTDDAIVRRRTTRELSANHGEYAVSALLAGLADQDNSDWNVTAMVALSQMDTHVVLPLTQALRSSDVFLRTNVAHVLRRIGDPRAAAALAEVLHTDEDGGVTKAATSALEACGGAGRSAVDLYIEAANAYYSKSGTVLREFDYSEVVWAWADGALVGRPVPYGVYADAMARDHFARGLALESDSLDALAGLARASVSIEAKLDRLAAAGEDVATLQAQAAESSLIVAAAGEEALDKALQDAVQASDAPAGINLCRALARTASKITTGLQMALDGEGMIGGEAAVAMGQIALANGLPAGADVINSLGESAGREISLLAAVIDSDAGRLEAISTGLKDRRAVVVPRQSGGSGLTMLRQLPGVDLIIIGDGMPDLTVDKVLSAIAGDAHTADTPVFLVTASQTTSDLYTDRVESVIMDVSDLSSLSDVLAKSFEGDRAEADELAGRAAATLADLAKSDANDLSGSLDDLASTLAERSDSKGRPDSVIVSAMEVLESRGRGTHIPALMGVLSGGSRSVEARSGAAHALAGIFGRHEVDATVAAALRGIVVDGSEDLPVRQAAARALARVNLDSGERASLMGQVSVPLSGD